MLREGVTVSLATQDTWEVGCPDITGHGLSDEETQGMVARQALTCCHTMARETLKDFLDTMVRHVSEAWWDTEVNKM